MDHDTDDDEFFGAEDDDDGCGLAGHEAQARDARYQNIGYLEAYDEHKEVRLQDGFEAGYQELHDISLRLGQLLGQLAAKTKFSQLRNDENDKGLVQAQQAHLTAISKRYREVMEMINRPVENKLAEAMTQSSTLNVNPKELMQALEHEVQTALESIGT